jgi:hypothetical protein
MTTAAKIRFVVAVKIFLGRLLNFDIPWGSSLGGAESKSSLYYYSRAWNR